MAFAKKTWKDRIAEFPTRRRLTKEDNTSELVTVAREEGTLSQEGDAFSAENMNDLENRIDAEFTEVNGNLNMHYNPEDDYIYIDGKKWKRAYLNSLIILNENGFSDGFALGNGININSGFNSEGVLSFNASTKEIYGNMPTAQYINRCNMISGAIDASNYSTISMKYRNSNGTYTLSGDISSYDTLYIGVALFNYPDNGNHVIALYLETSQTPGYLSDGSVYARGIANKNVGTGTFYITDIWLN